MNHRTPTRLTCITLFFIVVLVYGNGCGTVTQQNTKSSDTLSTESSVSVNTGAVRPFMQPCVVYKTRKMYDSLVPIILTPDKKDVQSYPAPVDMYRNKMLAYPTRLKNGYLLDNRGMSIYSVFITMKYDEYAALERTPSIKELMALIVDDDPITELYVCGERASYTNIVSQLNTMIERGELARQKRLK